VTAGSDNAARLFKVRPAIADHIRLPGGKKVGEAVAAADAALDDQRASAIEGLVQGVERLEALCRDPSDDGFVAIYPIAAHLAGTAGFFETGPFYRAVYSLCELTEKLGAAGRRDWSSVEVHVKALRLILTTGFEDGPEAKAMLDGLAALVRRVEGAS
jgi:hypothetical protein